MGKRSTFKRRPMDDYPTIDRGAVMPMRRIWRQQGIQCFAEPCAGEGQLINLLMGVGLTCRWSTDIAHTSHPYVDELDAFKLSPNDIPMSCDAIITNPPWTRAILHPLIEHLQTLGLPVWLLFDADWAHTKQAVPYIDSCSHVVSVGRLKWIPDSPHTGKDNCAWYRFHQDHTGGPLFMPQQLEVAA